MKLYRKLTTVLLAGVVALTVLTGCKTAVPKTAEDKYAEYIAIMNDCLKSKKLDDEVSWDILRVKEFKQDMGMNAAAQSTAKILQVEIEKGNNDLCENTSVKAELKKLLIKDGKDKNIYSIACVKNTVYESAYFNGRKQYELVQELFKTENEIQLDDVVDEGYNMAENAVVLTGFAEVKVKEDTYIVVVMQIPTELWVPEEE